MWLIRLPSYLLLYTLFGLSLLGSSSAFADDKEPTASLFYFGEKIHLYSTAVPNIFVDQFGERWIPLESETTLGRGRYLYKKVKLATQKEIDRWKKLTPTATPGIYDDHRGEQWLESKDPKTKEKIYIRLSEATPEDIKNLNLKNSRANLKWMAWNQAKEFPEQSAKFAVAQFIVEMTACYGLNVLTFTDATSSNPACQTEFFQHLLDPKGLAGFYMFMVASGYTTETTMRIIELSNKLRGTGVSNDVLRAKFMPYLGYFGMVAGSLASSVTEHVLSNQYWPACIASIKTEGLTNEYCIKVITSFTTDAEFWRNFGTSVPSLLLSSVAAHFTQQIVVNNYMKFTQSAALKRLNVTVISASEEVLQLVARFGPKAVKGVRVVGAIMGGIPGVVVFVVTEVGQFVGFLKYQEWFELPISRAVNDFIETNKAYDGMEKIEFATQASQKVNWQKAVIGPYNCKNIRTGRSQFKQVCEEEEILPVGLAQLKTGATNFRKKVLMNEFEAANAKWSLKVSDFMNKYKVSKLIIEHIYAQREKVPKNREMSLQTTVRQILFLWLNALDAEPSSEHPEAGNALAIELIALGQIIDELSVPVTPPMSSVTPPVDLITTQTPKETSGVLLAQPTGNQKLLNQILDFQKKSGRLVTNMFPIGLSGNFCLSTPQTCTALRATQEIDFSKLPQTEESDISENMSLTKEFIENISGVFGVDSVRAALGDMLCNENTSDFKGYNMEMNGRASHLELPMLLDLSDRDQRVHMQSNCSDLNGNRKFILDLTDFSRPWILGSRVFSDPISLLLDKNQSLTFGKNINEAALSWQTRAFPVGSQFLKTMTIAYQEMVTENLFPYVPKMSGDELLARSRPQMRGATLDYHIVTIGQSKQWWLPLPAGERPLLSESLLGQVYFLLEKIRYQGPDFKDKAVICDELLKKFSDHIANLNQAVSPDTIRAAWDTYENDVKYYGIDFNGIDKANHEFALNISKITMGQERLEKISQDRNEINNLVDKLYEGLTKYKATLLSGMDAETYMSGVPVDEVSKLSSEEYKKYIFYHLEYDSLSNILLEIRQIYDKLGLQVFSGQPAQTQ